MFILIHKEQNSNWDENDKKESKKKKKPVFNNNTTKSIFAIWIISIIFSFASIIICIIFQTAHILFQLTVFNGIAFVFIVAILIPSIVKKCIMENGVVLERTLIGFTCSQWFLAFLGTIFIKLTYMNTSITGNSIFDLYFIFVIFLIWAFLADFVCFFTEYIAEVGLFFSELLEAFS